MNSLVSDQYEPLVPGMIRILKLNDSSDFDAAIEGRLESCNLEHQQYAALSYAWGPSNEDGSHLTESIVRNGRRLGVTATLSQALRQIRVFAHQSHRGTTSSGRTGRVSSMLWIDAICINQANLVERAAQVQMMAEIYQRNDKLWIWLGQPDDGSLGERQLELIRCADVSKAQSTATSSLERLLDLQRLEIREDGSYDAGNVDSSERTEGNLTDESVVKSILAKPWFTRRWVIQETTNCNPTTSSVLLGSATCSLAEFRKLLSEHDLLGYALPLMKQNEYQSVLQTFYRYDACDCSDPRDYIFAIKDLTRRGMQIPVDYNQDVRNTYLSFVKIIAFGRNAEDEYHSDFSAQREPSEQIDWKEYLIMLALATCKARDVTDDVSLEGWVPDWRVKDAFVSQSHVIAVHSVMSTICQATFGTMQLEQLPSGYNLLLHANEILIARTRLTTSVSHEWPTAGMVESQTRLRFADRLLKSFAKHCRR